MSNNDLYCSKCESHHHPVECPMDDVETNPTPDKYEEMADEISEKFCNCNRDDLRTDIQDALHQVAEEARKEQIRKDAETLKKEVRKHDKDYNCRKVGFCECYGYSTLEDLSKAIEAQLNEDTSSLEETAKDE